MASIIGRLKQMARGNLSIETEDSNLLTVAAGVNVEIPAGSQTVLYGDLAVSGQYVVDGTLIVDAIPT